MKSNDGTHLAAYELESLVLVDLFPQTGQAAVAVLERVGVEVDG